MSNRALLGQAAVSFAKMPLRMGKVALDVAAAAPRLAKFAVSAERHDAVLPFEGPRTPLNGHLTPHRDFAFTSVPLALVDEVRGAFGASLNDVVLAMAAGALRDYLRVRNALPTRGLVAAVPMAIRREDHRADPDAVPGNLLSAMGAALPVHLDGPGDRVRAVQASTRAARRVHQVFGDDLLPDLLAVPPPVLIEGAVRLYDALALDERLRPVFAAVISNVPGPPVPLFCCGARLDDGYLIGPLLVGTGLNLTVLSYRDSLSLGVVSCPDVVDDHWAIARRCCPRPSTTSSPPPATSSSRLDGSDSALHAPDPRGLGERRIGSLSGNGAAGVDQGAGEAVARHTVCPPSTSCTEAPSSSAVAN